MVKAFFYYAMLLTTESHAFMGPLGRPPFASLLSVTSNPTLDVSGKYFQIEEMEDSERCTTEVLLKPDFSVQLLQTDGPLHKDAAGTWKFLPDGDFEMTLNRTYDAGQPTKDALKVGKFEFTTTRMFRGTLAHVGEKTSMEGEIIDSSDGQEKSVGFFEMIDSTTEGMDDWRPQGRSAASR